MAKYIAKKDCFIDGKRVRKGGEIEASFKKAPSYLEAVKQTKRATQDK